MYSILYVCYISLRVSGTVVLFSAASSPVLCFTACVSQSSRPFIHQPAGFDYNMPRSQKRYSHSHIACSSLRATRTHTFSKKALCLHHDTGNDCPASCFSTDEAEEQSSRHNAFTVNTHKR